MSEAVLGIFWGKVTESFPLYPLQGKVKEGIVVSYKTSVGNPRKSPDVPVSVGGNIDFMIGIIYLPYHPKLIYHIFIYTNPCLKFKWNRSHWFPHEICTKIEEHFRSNTFISKSFLSKHSLRHA